jgi:hypothetical protein
LIAVVCWPANAAGCSQASNTSTRYASLPRNFRSTCGSAPVASGTTANTHTSVIAANPGYSRSTRLPRKSPNDRLRFQLTVIRNPLIAKNPYTDSVPSDTCRPVSPSSGSRTHSGCGSVIE